MNIVPCTEENYVSLHTEVMFTHDTPSVARMFYKTILSDFGRIDWEIINKYFISSYFVTDVLRSRKTNAWFFKKKLEILLK